MNNKKTDSDYIENEIQKIIKEAEEIDKTYQDPNYLIDGDIKIGSSKRKPEYILFNGKKTKLTNKS